MTYIHEPPPSAPDIEEIGKAIRLRLNELRPLVQEAERLEKAEAALDKALARLDR